MRFIGFSGIFLRLHCLLAAFNGIDSSLYCTVALLDGVYYFVFISARSRILKF